MKESYFVATGTFEVTDSGAIDADGGAFLCFGTGYAWKKKGKKCFLYK